MPEETPLDQFLKKNTIVGESPLDAFVRKNTAKNVQFSTEAPTLIDDEEDPNNAERFIADVTGSVPVLRDVLIHFGRAGSALMNVADAGVRAVTGQEGALDRLKSAGAQGLDFVTNTLTLGAAPDVSDLSDFRSASDVLQTAGVGKLGTYDIPLIGKVTGRGTLGLGLDILTDPLRFARVGKLTAAGEAAKSAGALATAQLQGTKLGSRLAEQALQGQRALIGFRVPFTPKVIGLTPRSLDASVLGGLEGLRSTLATHPASPFRAFARYGGKAELKAAQTGAAIAGGEAERGFAEAGVLAAQEAERIAQRTGVPVEMVFEQMADAAGAGGRRAAKVARREALLSEGEALESAAAKKLAKARKTRSPAQNRIVSSVNSMLDTAMRGEAHAFQSADRLIAMADAAAQAGDEATGKALSDAAGRVLAAAAKRQDRLLALASRTEADIGRTAALAAEKALAAGERFLKRSESVKTPAAKAAYGVAGDEMVRLAERMKTVGKSPDSILTEAVRGEVDDIAQAERLVRGAVRTGVGPGRRLSRGVETEAFRILKREQSRTNRVLTDAARLERAHADVQATRLAPGEKLRAQAEERLSRAAAPELQPDTVRSLSPEDRARTAALMREYRGRTVGGETFTRTEAFRAARLVTMFDVDPDVAPLAAFWAEKLRGVIGDELRRGVAISHLSDPYQNYVTRAMTAEARALLKKSRNNARFSAAFGRFWNAKHPSALRRRVLYEGMPLPEMEKTFRAMFPEFEGRVWEVDPRRIAAVRGKRLGRAVSSSDYVGSVVRDFAKAASEDLGAEGWVMLDDVVAESGHVLKPGLMSELGLRATRPKGVGVAERVATRLGSGQGMMVPPEIAQGLKQTFRALADPQAASVITKAIRFSNQLFKTGVTALFPAFHIRNAIGNVWQNFVGGVTNPFVYRDAAVLMNDLRKGGARAWKLANPVEFNGRMVTELTSRQIADVMGSGHALGFGQFSAEELIKAEHLFGKAAGKLLDAPRRGGNIIESHAKIAHFLDRMAKGDSIQDAILSVKKYLFDYSDLSPIEKGLFRNIVPFYSWQRFNWPLMLETMFAEPGKVATLSHIDAAMRAREDGGFNLETTVLPPYITRRLFKTDVQEDGALDVVSGFGIPFEDIAILDRPFDEFLSMLTPLVKAPLQAITNRDFFRDLPLDRSELAPGFFKYLPAPFRDAIDFRPIDEERGLYRANPQFLNALWALPVVSGGSRFVNIAMRGEREGADEALKRWLNPIRTSTLSPQKQLVENSRRMLEAWEKRMEELKGQGITGELDNRFYVRRDAVLTDPRVHEARVIGRRLGRIRSAIGALSRAERVASAQEGLRSGGR